MSGASLPVARSSVLLDAARALVTELDLDAVLERLLTAARLVTGARYAAIGVLDESRQRLERFLTDGIDAATAGLIGDLPRGHGVLGLLIADPRPLCLESVSQHPRSYGFPPHHPPMEEFLGVPILIRAEPWGNLYLTDKAGGFDGDDERAAVMLSEWAAVAVDNARQFEESERRRQELERANAALAVTSDPTRHLGGETDVHRVLELLAQRARSLVDARAVLIALADGPDIVLAAGAGEVDAAALGARMPVGRSPFAGVCAALVPQRVSDMPLRRQWEKALCGPSPPHAALVVPLVFKGRAIGGLLALDRIGKRTGRAYSAEQERLLSAFASAAATAVATAQVAADDRVREAIDAADAERARWSRALHDETLQELAALSIELAGALRGDDARRREGLERASDHVRRQVKALRHLVTDLRPADLDDLGLAPALYALVERHREREVGSVELELDLPGVTDGGGRLAPELETSVYRLVQESLSNIAKHARTASVAVTVRAEERWVVVIVRDDGGGFDVLERATGLGLRGMRERAELLGGSLELQSGADGTQVSARMPIRYVTAG